MAAGAPYDSKNLSMHTQASSTRRTLPRLCCLHSEAKQFFSDTLLCAAALRHTSTNTLYTKAQHNKWLQANGKGGGVRTAHGSKDIRP